MEKTDATLPSPESTPSTCDDGSGRHPPVPLDGAGGGLDDSSNCDKGSRHRLQKTCAIIACFILQVLSSGTENTFGEFLIFLIPELGDNALVTVSVMEGCMNAIGFVTAPLIGIFGWRLLAMLGPTLCILGFLASSFITNANMFCIVYGVLVGCGLGLMTFVSFMYIQRCFSKNRSMATGIVTAGMGTGLLIFGPLLSIIVKELGWRMAMRSQAALMVLGFIPGLLVCPREPFEEESPLFDSSEEGIASLKAPSKDYGSTKKHSTLEISDLLCDPSQEEKPSKKIDLSLFGDPTFVLFTIAVVAYCFGNLVPFMYTPGRSSLMIVEARHAIMEARAKYLLEHNITTKHHGIPIPGPQEAVSILLSTTGGSIIASSILFGLVTNSNKVVRFVSCAGALLIQGIASFSVALFSTELLMILYTIVFGATTGIFWTTYTVVLVDLLGVDVIERALGQSLALSAIGYVLVAPVAGSLVDATGNINSGFTAAGLVQIVGTIFLVCTQLTVRHCKPCIGQRKG